MLATLGTLSDTLSVRFIYSVAKVGQAIVMGLIMGVVYLDLDEDNFAGRYGLFFSSMMQMGLGSMATLPQAFVERGVFYRQREASFFPTTAFVIAQNLVPIPLMVLECCIYGSLMYWLPGLNPSLASYLFFLFLLLSVNIAMAQFFRLLVSVIPKVEIAMPVASVFISLFVIFSGFIVAPPGIEPWFKWIYWANPLSWGFRALAQNEFLSDSYQKGNAVLPPASGYSATGDLYLDAMGFPFESGKWMPFGIAFIWFFWFVCFVVATAILHKHRAGVANGGTADKDDDEAIITTDGNLSHSVTSADEAGTGEEVESSLPFTPATLSFSNLSYSVDLPTKDKETGKPETLELLHEISGFMTPGTSTALMGSSGAGKTTLLDVLAGRKTSGHITGDIFVNGYRINYQSFGRVVGYVEQTDIHSPNATVKEALSFSALLRLSEGISAEEREKFVSGIMTTLELDPLADTLIGSKTAGGLSVEQAKRVTIGVELVANPAILFLDEPTSGLDARAAQLVMKAIKRTAQSGRAVISTIHQPSSFIFNSFDSLLLLKRGGHTVFFGELGENSCELIQFLQAAPGVTPITDGANPANFMVRCDGVQ